MGQAKQRGDKQARIEQAQTRLEQIKPKTLVCETCQAEITDITAQDSRNLPGIDGIFVGKCTQCGDYTQAVLGKKEAVEAYSRFMAEHARAHQHAPALPRIPMQNRRSADIVGAPTEEAVREQHAISDSATLLGYVVHFPRQQEYLAQPASAEAGAQPGYASNVHAAEVYSSYLKAQKASKRNTRDSEVQLLFDLDAELKAYTPRKPH